MQLEDHIHGAVHEAGHEVVHEADRESDHEVARVVDHEEDHEVGPEGDPQDVVPGAGEADPAERRQDSRAERVPLVGPEEVPVGDPRDLVVDLLVLATYLQIYNSVSPTNLLFFLFFVCLFFFFLKHAFDFFSSDRNEHLDFSVGEK